MDERRKLLKLQYKERKVVGAIYRILNQKNGKFYLSKTADLPGAQNSFKSCYRDGECTHPRLVKEWNEYGGDAFVFEVLETWEQGAEQTYEEFRRDLQDLLEIWDEKLPKENRY